MSATSALCGTYAGCQQHAKAGELPCADCRHARAAYMRDWRQRQREGRAVPYAARTPYPRSGLGWPA